MLTDHVQHATHWNFLGGINIYCFRFIYKEDKLFDFLKIMVRKDDILYEYVLAIYRCNSLYESVKEPIRIGQEIFSPMRKFYWVVAWVSVFWSTLTNAFFNSQMEMSHKDSTGNNTSLDQNKNWEIKRDKPDEFKKIYLSVTCMSDIYWYSYEFCSILINITTVPITLGSSFIVCQVFFLCVSYVEIIKSKILLHQAPVHVSTF